MRKVNTRAQGLVSRLIPSIRRTALCVLVLAALGACASSSSGDPELAPPATTQKPTAPEKAPAPDESSLDAALRDAEDLRAMAAAARASEADRPRSILPFGVTWAPAAQEGSAFGIRVLERPSGRKPESISGEFASLPVRFGRLDGHWFGLAAVPIDTEGRQDLQLRFEFDDGSTHEQTVPISVSSRVFQKSQLTVAPKYSSPSAEAMERIRDERELVRSVLDTASAEWLIDTAFRAPRPLEVTSPYGVERVFNGELRSRHTGLDLKGAPGEPVRAAARGRVMIARDLYFSGNGVYLDHGRGVYTGYFHLSRILVEEGEMLEAGQIVGEVGATGRVTGPHLHWSLWVGGTSLDAGSLLEMSVPVAIETP
ncbi:MAG: M23 family metallopeptidase [marine benthic group bacterium]|nr:M23 family metallopeptidase [Candidatus Carthagonibacter metallireducens]